MNRIIKFRVWDKLENRMMDWSSVRETELLDDAFDGKDAVAMQFTGLKDKNEWEIYEGDIIKCFDEEMVVVWSNDGLWFAKDIFAANNIGQELFMYPKCEIIGNIFQNPELLKA